MCLHINIVFFDKQFEFYSIHDCYSDVWVADVEVVNQSEHNFQVPVVNEANGSMHW